MELAFEIPEHLPRPKTHQPPVSIAVLTALAETSPVTLPDVTKWVDELNQAILETKVWPRSNAIPRYSSPTSCLQRGIHELVHQDFGTFQRQLDASRNIQRRLAVLTTNVHALGEELNNEGVSGYYFGTRMVYQVCLYRMAYFPPCLPLCAITQI